MKIEESSIKLILEYLYNYQNLDNIIKNTQKNILDINLNISQYKRSVSRSNKLIDQEKLFQESTELRDLYFWKKNLDIIIKYVEIKFPELYKYIELRFFNKLERKEIKKLLNISFAEQEKLDRKLFRIIDRHIYVQKLEV